MDDRDQALWRLSGTGPERLLALPPALRRVVLRQLELHAARRVAEDLARLLEAPWWAALSFDDRVRATRIVAHVSARASGAQRAAPGRPCPRTILDGTLDSILPPRGCFRLRFEDLRPAEAEGEGVVVAGLRLPPDTVVLDRRAIAASNERLGASDGLEVRVGLATLVHEINHLHHLTPVGPTYEAFQDEYRAWLVDFVAYTGGMPRRLEALARCEELLTCPAYAALGQALTSGSDDGARILAFVRRLDPRAEEWAAERAGAQPGPTLQATDPLAEAPLPEPPGNLGNAPPAAAPAVPPARGRAPEPA